MGFSISGFVLEPPRIGQANSPFTNSPNTIISDQAVFDAAYPSDESEPRNDYLVLVTSEGWGATPPPPPKGGLLENAGFGWTKNEVIQRFDYKAQDGQFKPLPGGEVFEAGVLVDDASNEDGTRLSVPPPVEELPEAPFRLIVEGQDDPTVLLVLTNDAFDMPVPPLGSVQLSLKSGDLNWNATDLTAWEGSNVRFQQQQFFSFDKSTGRIGVLTPPTDPTAPIPNSPTLLLNPIPGDGGQIPLIRIGYSLYMTAVEVANEAAFTAYPGPVVGTVEWARDTGTLNFSATDISTNPGVAVYYDGVLFARDLTLSSEGLGDVDAPTPITLPLPPIGGDLIFVVAGADPYYRFPSFSFVEAFDPSGKTGVVQIIEATGDVQFSLVDQSRFAGLSVEVFFGDLPIENGVSIRLFRSVINLNAALDIKDVTAFYGVENAIWASPIVGVPEVFLPSVPVDDSFYLTDDEWFSFTGQENGDGRLDIQVVQGQGSFTGPLARLDVGSPPNGFGYFINFDTRTFNFAQRKSDEIVPILQAADAVLLPDPLVLTGNLTLALESDVGSGNYIPLTLGVDALFEPLSGLVTFANTQGVNIVTGLAVSPPISFTGNTFTDNDAEFQTANVLPGDLLLVQNPPAKGVYTIIDVVSETVLTTDVVAQTPSLTDPPVPVSASNVSYTIQRGREILADRFFQEAVLVDPSTKVERLRNLGAGQNESAVVSSSGTLPDFLTLEDLGTDFIAADVRVGDTLVLGVEARVVTFVALNQLTVDAAAPFTDLGTPPTVEVFSYSVVRRLRVPLTAVNTSRFRFGDAVAAVFSDTSTVVATDFVFGSPPSGTVEISQETGNLNFNAADISGVDVYWVNTQTLKIDYQLQAGSGLIRFTDRMLGLEEVLLTYTTEPPSTTPTTDPDPPKTEYATFIVRKEVTQDHPVDTTTLFFNPTGLPVADLPLPEVFRGGRPQQTNVQVTIDSSASSMTFLADDLATDALPHGAIIASNERVYIDYHVLAAVGGEQTTTVLEPPILTAVVTIRDGESSFTAHFDQTSVFQADHLMRIEQEEVYLIGSATYDGGEDLTTVTLAGTQVFQNDFTDPRIYVTSGETRITAAPFLPPYFVPELQAFEPVARGMNRLFVLGDRTGSYLTGTVVYATDSTTSFTDFLPVTGSKFDPEKNRTEITLATTSLREYVFGSQILQHSVRPIFEDPTTTAQTSNTPIPDTPLEVYRRKEGEAGVLLAAPTDYKIDGAGIVILSTPLLSQEEFTILYTSNTVVQAGRSLRASYTFSIAPNEINGIAGQILLADYTIFAPDSFYYRVETLTNFRGEVALEIAADAASATPSSGPQTDNASQPQLFQQGRESVFFPEGHIANQDIIARSTLLFYNDAVNHLEDALQNYDGRVVGNNDGRFLFDGTTGIVNPSGAATFPNTLTLEDLTASFTSAIIGRVVRVLSGSNSGQQRVILAVPVPTRLTLDSGLPTTDDGNYRVLALNQIDDTVKISDAPYELTFSPSFVLTSIGTFQQVYIPGSLSRFFQTAKNFFAITAAGFDSATEPDTGTGIADTGSTNLTNIGNLRTRSAWAKVTTDAPAGASSLLVDNTEGTEEFYRPPFLNGMKCVIQDRDGTFIVDVAGHLPVTVVDVTELTIAVPAAVPAGSTIFRSPLDDSGGDPPSPPATVVNGLTYYQLGRDYNFNPETGQILYVRPIPPLDGSVVGVPEELEIHPFPEEQFLSGNLTLVNTKTEPCRVPMLDGGTADDDGDVSFPIQSPSPDSEFSDAGGFVAEELAVVSDGSPNPLGTFRTRTPVYTGTGNLSISETRITDVGAYPAPAPKINDLVRITSGANSTSLFRRVTGPVVVTNYVEVSEPFAVDGSPFTYEVAVSASVFQAVGVGIDNFPTATKLEYLAGGFNAAVQVGQTIIFEDDDDAGERRQVVNVETNEILEFDLPLPESFETGLFHVDDSIATYGNTPNDQLTRWENALLGQQSLYTTNPGPPPDTVTALENFFESIFTDIVVSANGSVAAGGTTLTDATTTFDATEINSSSLIYIRNGVNQGIYQVDEVTDEGTPPPATLEILGTFPFAETGMSYRVVSSFGVSKASMDILFQQILDIEALAAGITPVLADLAALPVLRTPSDPDSFAQGVRTPLLDTRSTATEARIAALDPSNPDSPVVEVESVLVSADRLYDARFVWIDARINVQNGLLVLVTRAEGERIQTQEDVFKQLTKLLAVEGA